MGEKNLEEEVRRILNDNLEKRKLCNERGYHRIEKEPETDNDSVVCYDCCLGFNRLGAKMLEIKYVVERRGA